MYKINSKQEKPDIGYLVATVEQLMQRGIRVTNCEKLRDTCINMRDTIKNDIIERYGIDNPNSPKQVTYALEQLSKKISMNSKNDIVNICYDKDNDKWTSNGDALEKLADLGYELAQDMLDYRHVKKYAESLESILKAADDNKLIHPIVTLSKTNRINYRDPALMNIPKELLWDIIAPYNSDSTLYSIDIKNQEPGILINMLNAEELKPALESPDGLYENLFKQCFKPFTIAYILNDTLSENRMYSIDEIKQIGTMPPAYYKPIQPITENVYYNDKRVLEIGVVCSNTTKGLEPQLPDTIDISTEDGNIYQIPVIWKDVDKHIKKSYDYELQGELQGLEVRVSKAERKEFKTAWLAISYGQSAFGTKMACKIIDGKYAFNYITKVKELKTYRDMIEKVAKQGTATIGTYFGTKLYVGEYYDWKELKRKLLDLPIQGTGADILSLLVKHFHDEVKTRQLENDITLYYTRHDEVIVEVKNSLIDKIGEEQVETILRDIFEHQVDNWTPFHLEVNRIKSVNTAELSLNYEDDND